jgi:ubiquinone/menaquinone biosynthesis C-methylase UbiE
LSVRLLSGFLRAFFHLLYHQFAWTYDLVAAIVSLGHWKDWVLTPLPELAGPRVLELGHGPGHLQAAMTADSAVIGIGLDKSINMGYMAMRNLLRRREKPNLVNATSQFLPFASRSFNQIVATFPTEYILLPQTLSEIRRALAPGGTLVIVPVAWITGTSPLERAAAWLFRATGQAGDVNSGYSEYIGTIARAGFEVQPERIALRNSEVLLVKATPRQND